MISSDASLTSAAASARAFSAGVARTLARGRSAVTAGDGAMAQADPAAAAAAAAIVDTAPPPDAGGAADASTPRRSNSQMAALLTRMIAQGQRNL
jgi:hypothetical protein